MRSFGAALAGLSFVVHGVCLAAAGWSGDDRVAALAATASFAWTAAAGVRALGLHPLSPAMLYLWTLGVFHLGLIAPWAVGLDGGSAPLWMTGRPLGEASALLVLAFASYQAGLAFVAARPSRPAAALRPLHNTAMYRIGLVVAAAGAGLLVAGAWVIGFDRLAGATYFESYGLTRLHDPRLFVSSMQVFPMGLYLAAAAAPPRRLLPVAALGLAWAAAIFLLGYRGFALTPIATLLALLHKRGLRLPRVAWVAGLLVISVAVPAARSLRDSRLGERSLTEIEMAGGPLEALREMGGSVRALVQTIELARDEPLRWGYSYGQAARMVVPNLAFEWEADEWLPVEKLPPSRWLARLATPWHYQRGGGLGFSAVAEPYLNFGWPGVVLYFALLAAALVALDRADRLLPARLAAWAMILGPLLWTSRNASTVFVRPAVWGLLLVLAAAYLSRLAAEAARREAPARTRSVLSPGGVPA